MVTVLITGCASANVKKIISKSGLPAYIINCTDVDVDSRDVPRDCGTIAGNICQNHGYTVILKDTFVGSNTPHVIIVECR